jgi:hypothetical protein
MKDINKIKQEYSNQRHWVPLYHLLTFAAMGAVVRINSFVSQQRQVLHASLLFVLMVLTLISVSFHCRSFALTAQDSAISAEENLRYFTTGKRLN